MTDLAREAGAQHWSDSARAWARAAEEEETGASAATADWIFNAAQLQAGERVLELACGAGRIGLEAASRVGSSGAVLCSDFSEAMVEAVSERVDRLGVTNVEARVLDAQDIDLDRERFDVVLCRFGYMLMGNPLRALAESRRVLDADGRLVLAVWGEAERNPWLSTIFDAVMAHLNAPPPEPGTPGPFALGDVDELRLALEQAGFVDVEVAEIETEQAYESPEGWWGSLNEISGPLAAVLSSLSEADREAIRNAAIGKANDYVTADGAVSFPASVVGAKTGRPPSAS